MVREHRKFRLSSIFAVDYATTHHIVINFGHFKLPLPIEIQKLGFQDQEDGTKLEITERSVRVLVREHRKFRLSSIFAVESTTTHRIVIKVGHFKLPLPIEIQKLGFQDQEDGAILENEEHSVRYWYVSTYSVFVENTLRKHNLSVALHLRRRINFHEPVSSSKSCF